MKPERELIEEALRRGFESGVVVKCLFKGTELCCGDDFYLDQFGRLWGAGWNRVPCIFKNGEWTEIIKHNTLGE